MPLPEDILPTWVCRQLAGTWAAWDHEVRRRTLHNRSRKAAPSLRREAVEDPYYQPIHRSYLYLLTQKRCP